MEANATICQTTESSAVKSGAISKIVNHGARIVLGSMLLAFGVNKFMGFMPMPPFPEAAMKYMGAMMATGYMLPAIGILELLTGVLIVSNRFTALGLVLLAPLSVNIILFHVFLDPAGIGPGAILTALNVYLAFVYRNKFKSVLAVK